MDATCLSSSGGEFAYASRTGESGVVSASVVAAKNTTLFSEMILTDSSDSIVAANAIFLPSYGGEAADSPCTGGSNVVSPSVVVVADTALFAELILTEGATGATRSDFMTAVNVT